MSSAMPRWQRAYLAACFAAMGFCVAYVLCDYAEWPRLTYDQYGRSWELVDGRVVGLPSNYVGTVLWGLGGAAVGGAAGWVVGTVRRRALSNAALSLVGAWTVSAFIYGGLYYTWSLWPF